MSKVKSLLLIIFMMIAVFLVFPFTGMTKIETSDDSEKRPDIIQIQLDKDVKKLELPAVGFMHDLHTAALEGDCAQCHQTQENVLIFKFMRTDDPGSKELYHDGCISCHDKKKAEGAATGPAAGECRACHTDKMVYGSSWEPIAFDRSLHFAHESSKQIKAKDKSDTANCSSCHHQANMKSKEVFYVKGEESACVYCHASETETGLRNAQQAAHDSCVACHQQQKAANKEAGPVDCRGCHEASEQKKIKQMTDIPRLNRNQPDAVAITGWSEGADNKAAFMPAVAFNHALHETKTQSCKACHHQTLKKCSDCHTPDGNNADGGFVNLETAMHSKNSTQSCVGCHTQATQSKDCAGCHAMMPATAKKNPESCKACHAIEPKHFAMSEPKALAEMTLQQRKKGYTQVDVEQIPEVVTIDILAKDYKASQFPHRKVVQAVFERAEKSAMAGMFHQNQATLCMGCHHNTPQTLEPPKCVSCHSKKGPSVDGRPGLKGAYHGQCITCHQKMEVTQVAATDCVKCHEAK